MGWTAKGDISTARKFLAATGTTDAALIFGGDTSATFEAPASAIASTEEYGSAVWSAGGDLPAAVTMHDGCGTQTAALSVGGANTSDTTLTSVYSYNGTAWSAVGSLSTSTRNSAVFGTTAAAVSAGGGRFSGGSTYPPPTQSYNGVAWSAGADANYESNGHMGSGTQTTGLCAGCYSPGF